METASLQHEQDDSLYLEDILDALNEINKDDSFYNINDVPQESEEGETSSESELIQNVYERCFAYELYHQIRLRMNKDCYKDLVLNGETGKSVHVFQKVFFSKPSDFQDDDTKRMIKKFQKKFSTFYPDLVLHHPGNFLNQVYIVEIKMDTNPDYCNDFKKLTDLKRIFEKISSMGGNADGMEHPNEDARFKYYIFIYSGFLLEKLVATQRKTWDKIKKYKDSDIICFYKDLKKGGDYVYKYLGEVVLEAKKMRRQQQRAY